MRRSVYSVDAIRLSVASLLRRSSVACSLLVEEGDQLSCGPVECAAFVSNARPYRLVRLAIEAILNLLDGP
jgi:hypothetical protein